MMHAEIGSEKGIPMKKKHLFSGALIVLAALALGSACSSDKAILELTYSPADAEVKIDGYSPDSYKSPYVFEFYKPGLYTLEVSAPGHIPVKMRIEVAKGHVTKQTIHLVKTDQDDAPNVIATDPPPAKEQPLPEHPQPTQMDFSLTINTVPPGATATIQTNGMKSVKVLKTPATQTLEKHVPWQVNITHDGYEPVSRTVVAPVDKDEVVLNVQLQKKNNGPVTTATPATPPIQAIAVGDDNPTPSDSIVHYGWISVSTSPWTVVHINGKVIGNTPIRNHKLAPGRYTVLMENRERSKRKIQTVDIAPGSHIRLDQDL